MTTTFTKKKSYIPHFPIFILGGTIALTLITMVWIGFAMVGTVQRLEHAVTKEFRALELRGLILKYDEMLTHYTQMGILLGDKGWEDKYNAVISKLTGLINEAIVLAPSARFAETASKTDLANQQLNLIEHQAFLLSRQGKKEEARQLLNSAKYVAQKKNFLDGMDAYGQILQQQAKAYLEVETQKVRYILMAIVAELIFLTLAWLLTLKNIFAWKRELEAIIVMEMRYKQEIESARHFLHEMSLINKMNDRLQMCQELNEAYSVIQLAAQELFPLLSGGLCMRHPLTNEIETVQSWGKYQILKTTFNLDDCWALRESHVYIVNNPKSSLLCQHFDVVPNRGYMCMPLIVQNGVMGMLELNTAASEGISDYQQQLAITFSEVLRLSIGNIQLRETLNEQAAHDPLTGLFNRRYLNETLPRELQRVIRAQRRLCVAMLDIDFFKKMNDTYGHDAGDEVLKFVANQLKLNTRASDIACRYGGEEFILVMSDSTLDEAMPRLRQICQEIKEGHLHYMKDSLPSVTVSIGVSEGPTHSIAAVELVRLADEALYKAKQGGRDRIEIFNDL